MSLFGYAEIQSILPHRYPMLMVDAVLSLEPQRSIVAIKCVTGNEPCYARLPEDSTRQRSAYPVSLIVESFSQAGAILWMKSAPTQGSSGVLMFGVARDCVFERDVFPGDTMQHRVRLERAIADSLFLSGETWVGDRRIARLGWLVAVARPAETLAR
jgi:3-hydroxyacyl-[acyl-carrier-protein] dehydratase